MIAPLDVTFTPSPLRRMFCSLFFVAVAIATLGTIGSSRATGQGSPGATANKIDPWVIEHTANSQQAELMVVLVDQADLHPAADLPTAGAWLRLDSQLSGERTDRVYWRLRPVEPELFSASNSVAQTVESFL